MRDDAIHKIAVVRDGNHRAGEAVKIILENCKRFHVEVVRRLVEEEDIRRLHQDVEQLQAAALSAGETGDFRVLQGGGEQEALEHLRGRHRAFRRFDAFGGVADEVNDALRRIELLALLTEEADFHCLPERYFSFVRGEAARQHAQQCALAAAVRPDDAETVAARQEIGKVMKQAAAVIRFSNGLGLDHLFPETAREGGEGELFLLLRSGLAAQLLKAVDAELRLCAARLRPALYPGKLLFEQRLTLALARGQHFRALCLELEIFRVVCGILIERASLYLHDAVRDALKEVPVVRDHHDGPVEFRKEVLQPENGVHINVVGGFVEEKQLGMPGEGGGQGGALLLPAGEEGNVAVKVAQAQPREQGAAFVFRRVACRGVQHGLAQNGEALREFRVLRQVRRAQARHARDGARVRRVFARQNFEQRRLSRPVHAHNADSVALVDREGDFLQKRLFTVAFADFFRCQIYRHRFPAAFPFCPRAGALFLIVHDSGRKSKAFSALENGGGSSYNGNISPAAGTRPNGPRAAGEGSRREELLCRLVLCLRAGEPAAHTQAACSTFCLRNTSRSQASTVSRRARATP